MSKQQWGHGFHAGVTEGHESGFETGFSTGDQVGAMSVGESAWHSVDAAILAIEAGNVMRGLMLLRTLRPYLAGVTGRINSGQRLDNEPPRAAKA